jgi:glutaredoxin
MCNLVIVLLLFIIVAYYACSDINTYIVRYHRPSCKYCVESQQEWDLFKAKHADDLIRSNVFIIDVDTSQDTEHTRYWCAKYNFQTVPTVVKLSKFSTKVFDKSRTCEEFYKFAM